MRRPAVTAGEMREIDRRAIEEFAVPGIVLMENAGRSLAGALESFLERRGTRKGRVAVFCGSGNNGGDGLVAARHLHNRGHEPVVLLVRPAEDFRGAPLLSYTAVVRCGIPVKAFGARVRLGRFDAVIDALLGTGTRGEAKGGYRDAIESINRSGRAVFAADIPSGLDADTGEAPGGAVRAAVTVTMGIVKRGLLSPRARTYVGKLVVADIGLPRALRRRQRR